MSDALHLKYRPRKFADVLGQDAAVKSIQGALKRGSQTFLLIGPSGVGKTTIARIGAHTVGCKGRDIRELDAATFTGIDDMRKVQELIRYEPFGDSQGRAIIIDECHSLSKQAWQSLLKVTEEPPKHVYWFFCTTEPGKVPPTIKTRAVAYTLKNVPDKALGQLYDKVCKAEGIKLHGDVGGLIITEAGGSPRQMLVNLATCRDAETRAEAADLLRSALASDITIELCRLLNSPNARLVTARKLLVKIKNEEPESVRIVVCNYTGKVAVNAKDDRTFERCCAILTAFGAPYNRSEGIAPLARSLGELFLS